MRDVFSLIKKYRKIYRNNFRIIFQDLTHKYPLEATLKNGRHIIISTRAALVSVAEIRDYNEVQYDFDSNTWVISSLKYLPPERMLKIRSDIDNGEVVSIFMKNIYGEIPVKGKVVVDIGANVGDSCIYFALRGANKVIGVEPFRKSYDFAKENIVLNNLNDKITILMAACGSEMGNMTLDPNYPSTISSKVTKSCEQGIKVRVLTLEHIIHENKLESRGVVLKMDCEGCEYNVILSTNDIVLRQFTYMYIEYHNGYKNLKDKLENCGFDVTVTRPTADPPEYKNDPWQYLGIICADRI